MILEGDEFGLMLQPDETAAAESAVLGPSIQCGMRRHNSILRTSGDGKLS